jgi:hypothetical protein
MAQHTGVSCVVGENVLEKLQDSGREEEALLTASQDLSHGRLGRADPHNSAVATRALRRFFSCFVSPFGGHFGDPHFFLGRDFTFEP